jgi:CheY-like chemotaxis protein
MPEMDGIELSRQIRLLSQETAVIIMISAAEWSAIEEEARKAGIEFFLPKPLFPSSIADIINRCLGPVDLSPAAEDMPRDDFTGYRILLAEDVEINREILTALLEPTSLTIESAVNGADALRLFVADPDRYDLIFMDVQMPEMDGYEATERIRSSGVPQAATIPILAMTANVFREDIDRCLKAGMNGHVGKPLDIEEVLTRLREYLPDKPSIDTGEAVPR